MPQRGFSTSSERCALPCRHLPVPLQNLAMHEVRTEPLATRPMRFTGPGRRLLLPASPGPVPVFRPGDSMSFAAAACSCWLFCGTWDFLTLCPEVSEVPARAVPVRGVAVCDQASSLVLFVSFHSSYPPAVVSRS